MKIEIEYYDAGGFGCLSETCKFKRTCAQHVSAGDYRTEDGFTPELEYVNGVVICRTANSPPEESFDEADLSGYPCNYNTLPNGALNQKDLSELSAANYQI